MNQAEHIYSPLGVLQFGDPIHAASTSVLLLNCFHCLFHLSAQKLVSRQTIAAKIKLFIIKIQSWNIGV